MNRLVTTALLLLTIMGLGGCFGRETIERHQVRAAKSQAKVTKILQQVVEANQRGVIEVTNIDTPLTTEAVSSLHQIADMLTAYFGTPEISLENWEGAPALVQQLRDARWQADLDTEKANEEARKRDEELAKMTGEFAALQDEVGPLRDKYAETAIQLKKYESLVRIPWLVTLGALSLISLGGFVWFGIGAWFRTSTSMGQAIGLTAVALTILIFGGIATTWWYVNGRMVIQWAFGIAFILLLAGGVYLAKVSGALKSVIRGAEALKEKGDAVVVAETMSAHQDPVSKAIVKGVRKAEGM